MSDLRRALAALLFSWVAACGTDAQGTSVCRSIEQARCNRAAQICPALGIQGEQALDECVTAARDRCEHGLAVADPGATVTDKCVKAISETSSCAVVASPETTPECAFLVPTAINPEVGTDAAPTPETGAGDAPSE
jgi:hypothetical protein